MLKQQMVNILSNFQTISLEEMDTVRLMQRTDTKYAFTTSELLRILPLLKDHYKVLKINDVLLSTYESTYFDDEELTSYQDHHNKKLYRSKIRFRKYIDSDIIFFEIKLKIKGRTVKHRIPVSEMRDEISPEQMGFIRNAGFKGEQLHMVLRNTYNRMTLVGINHPERLTIDVNLSYNRDGKIKIIPNIAIAELKQDKADRTSPFYQMMREARLRPSGVSKYCIGVIKLFGKKNVKYNRFKKNLIIIKKIKKHVA